MRILSSLLMIMIPVSILAQTGAPQGLNYQAVARNSNGVIVPSQNIGVRFTIINGSINGTTVYEETHNATTNSFGLFTLAIGKGTVTSGTFSAIDWGNGDKFLKVEIAPQGGNNYTLQGTTQFLSVPYALYSEKTKLLAGNNTINITNGNTISGNYQAANNTLTVNGNLLSGNYQAANNTLTVNGNLLSGNYQAANNTLTINGNQIAGNYQPGNATIGINGNQIIANYLAANNTILINGNQISGNYQAGTGINIVGNVISATGTTSNLWVADANGIHNQSGNVGIGLNSLPASKLSILQTATGGFSSALDISSADVWHTIYRFRNTTVNQEYQFMVGGSLNHDQIPGSFGILNITTAKWPFYIGNNDLVGFGSTNLEMPVPKSRLHVFNGDVNIDQIGSGIILKSPNGSCWRVTIDNAGNLVRTAIACP